MMSHWLSISLLLAFLSLDVSAVGQFMVSRPIVVGPLVGLLTGHADLGLELGALVELIWLGDVPVGAHLPLDLSMLAGLSVAFASELADGPCPKEAAVTYALGVAIPLSAVCTQAEIILRKFHVRWVHFAQRMAMNSRLRSFEWVNHIVIFELFLKGFFLTAGCLFIEHCTTGIFHGLPPRVIEGLYYANWLLLALGCSAVIDLVVEKKNILWLVLSIAALLTLALVLQVQEVWLVAMSLMAGFVATLFFMGKGESA